MNTYLILSVLGFAGFLISYYIYRTKATGAPLICPARQVFQCEEVIKSDYSRLFGFPNEVIGMIYFVPVTAYFLIAFLSPGLVTHSALVDFLVVGAIAAVFSFVLILIQAFALRKLCSWCLLSALICFAIFFIVLNIAQVGYVLF